MTYKKKLIEVALPLGVISKLAVADKNRSHGHPQTLHKWWARRPLPAVRAVLWCSLVDDPSSHPDEFPTAELQEVERQRLFRILEALVKWENSNDKEILDAAHGEIVESCDGELPNILDPFCGGGTIPLEAQRLGLPAYGGDLNPVAVLISKAMVEIPAKFAGLPPVNPESQSNAGLRTWERAEGLAEDIRYYGKWMRDRAFERIGHLYPKVELPPDQGSGEATVIAWIWARTVESPDPSWSGHVPLVRSWVLRKAKKNKPVVWVEAVVDSDTETVTYRIREGATPNEGTVRGGAGRCIATGSVISGDYIKAAGRSGTMLEEPIAAVVETVHGRSFVEYAGPDLAAFPVPEPWRPTGSVPKTLTGGTCYGYGLTEWGDLFTKRQAIALDVLSGLIHDARGRVMADLLRSDDERPEKTVGSESYADAIATYMAFSIDKSTDWWSSLTTWDASNNKLRNVFARQAIPMTWDFAEANPFSSSTGNWLAMVEWIAKAVAFLPTGNPGDVEQRDATARLFEVSGPVISTDPPYYDNILYSDLSDFFYVWMRRSLGRIYPNELSTVSTPKADELVANRRRAGSAIAARDHFEQGMQRFLAAMATQQNPSYPATIYYAYKQEETDSSGTASTGWETFLSGIRSAGMAIVATWPIEMERRNRPVAAGTASLASTVVLVLRPRPSDAPLATRSEFVAALRSELPGAVRLLQRESIAPVDMAQSAIGPGMAVFSRYAKVIEADGSDMSVRQALMLINEVLQETLSAEETEFDPDTRWALTWFEQFGLNPGPYGDAETLSKAKNTSAAGVVTAGIAVQHGGEVRLLDRDELDPDWDPTDDLRLTVWEVSQYLIRALGVSEPDAAGLLRQVGSGMGEQARQLAYLLYQVADRKGWSEEAVAYNGLVQAWPDLTRLAAQSSGPVQITLGE